MRDYGLDLTGSENGLVDFSCKRIIRVVIWDVHSLVYDYRLLDMTHCLLATCYHKAMENNFETSVANYPLTRRHIPEDRNT
jgi:hypothetical protein